MNYPSGSPVPLEFYFTKNGAPLLNKTVTIVGIWIDNEEIGGLIEGIHYPSISEIGFGSYGTILNSGITLDKSGGLRAVATCGEEGDLEYSRCFRDIGAAKSDIVSVCGLETPAQHISESFIPIEWGTVEVGHADSIETSVLDDLGVAPIGCIIEITSGAGKGQRRLITEYDPEVTSGSGYTVDHPWLVIPQMGDNYKVWPSHEAMRTAELFSRVDGVDVQNALDAQGYSSGRAVNLDYLDTNVSGIVPSIGNMIADVIAAIGTIAAAVWSYPERTINFTLARLMQYLAGIDMRLRRGDDIACPLTLTSSIEGWEKLWVTLKTNVQDSDSDAVFMVILTNPGDDSDGLQVMNGVELESGEGGSILVTSNITLVLNLSVDYSVDLKPKKDMVFDVQAKINGKIQTVKEGSAEVTGDVTRSVE